MVHHDIAANRRLIADIINYLNGIPDKSILEVRSERNDDPVMRGVRGPAPRPTMEFRILVDAPPYSGAMKLKTDKEIKRAIKLYKQLSRTKSAFRFPQPALAKN